MSPQVLAVVEQFWHKLPGGTAMATERTLAHLAELNEFHITGLAARHAPPADGGLSHWRRMPAGSTLRFHHLPRPVLYESWLRLGYPSVDRYRRGSAVVWASSLIVPATTAPIVATVHDLDFLDHPEYLSRRGRRFFPLMWAKARERADRFVCPSQTVADDCVRHGIDPDRISIVPWGVDRPACAEGDVGPVAAGLDLPERFVLWVGPSTPRKNPERAAAALERLSVRHPVHLVVVGSSARRRSVDAFERFGSRVRRLARVDDRTLSALYHRAEVLLYPSLVEGFGLPVLEAMAHGTPVVTSSTTATAEVAGGAALTVDPTDVEGITAALESALFDQATRRRLIEDGLTRAGQMSWDVTAKGYAEAFHSVL